MVDQRTPLRFIYQGYAEEPALQSLSGHLVLPEGSVVSPSVIICGEGPGKNEAEELRPFVGRAGRMLDGMLLEANLPREHCYVTNILKLRATGPDGKDRPPRDGEVLASMPYLWRELSLVGGCKVICALGRTAASGLCGEQLAISRSHGKFNLITDPVGVKYAVFVTYHPAAALRSQVAADLLQEDLTLLSREIDKYGARAAVYLA